MTDAYVAELQVLRKKDEQPPPGFQTWERTVKGSDANLNKVRPCKIPQLLVEHAGDCKAFNRRGKQVSWESMSASTRKATLYLSDTDFLVAKTESVYDKF